MTYSLHVSIVSLVLLCLALAGCSAQESASSAGQLEQIRASQVLTVATRNAPTSYYINRRRQPTGPEYALVEDFARSLGVETQYRVMNSISAVLKAVASGQADLAAAGLTRTPARAERFRFGPDYQQVTQQVVCRTKMPQAKSVEQLSEVTLAVSADSSYEERLQELQVQHSDLTWKSVDDVGTEQLLRKVWKKKLDCTVADSNIVDINQRYYPQLKVMFDLGDTQHLAWVMPSGAEALAGAAEDWLGAYRGSGKLAKLQDRFYGYLPEFDYVDKQKLVERIEQRYQKYQPLFVAAADRHDVPEDLLAAQAYQESHWDPVAKSPTGVRGIMMLTRRTAKELGVDDRLDPAQSIAGGARYLEEMQSRLDDSIPEPDRTYLALAAYNVGLAHVRDARKLAEQMGKNPDSWAQMRDVLPLLADKRYYPKLKYGYARGTEPVRYIDRIRDYRDVIAQHTQ